MTITDIFHYTDYQKYLSDVYGEKKAVDASFTFRFIAEKLGLKSSAFFALIIAGKRKLPQKLILPISLLLNLDKKETDYFELLVRYSHSKTQLEKQFYFERISRFLKVRVKTVSPDKYEFYEKWYYSVIREVLRYFEFNDNYKALSNLIRPSISPAEAKKSIEVLERLQFIHKDEAGFYRPSDIVITAGDEWQSQAIRNLQATYMDLGKEALNSIRKEERDISNLTLNISEKSFNIVKERIKTLRMELLELAKNDANADNVYLVNLQAFPVTNATNQGDAS